MSEGHDAVESAAGPEFAIRRIYVKDLSFESPMSPGIFAADWNPDVEIQVQSAATNSLSMLGHPAEGDGGGSANP